jgi:nitrite reductase (NADH) small subunit
MATMCKPLEESLSCGESIKMAQWVAIARIEQCPPGQALELVAGDRIVALYNVDGEFFALDGVCPHQGGPLGRGCLSGAIVTCPWHGWQFDVRTGQHQLSRTLKQPQFELRVEQGQVLIQLPDG